MSRVFLLVLLWQPYCCILSEDCNLFAGESGKPEEPASNWEDSVCQALLGQHDFTFRFINDKPPKVVHIHIRADFNIILSGRKTDPLLVRL